MTQRFLRNHVSQVLRHLPDVRLDDAEREEIDGFESRCSREMDKLGLQLMQIACKNERLQRALDIASQLVLGISLEKALKVATFNHLSGLSDRIRRIQQVSQPFYIVKGIEFVFAIC
jgi:chromosome transmission fidelity protein 4